MIQLVNPLYAHERAADLGTTVRCSQEPADRVPVCGFEISGTRSVDAIARAFYDAHYWGRPSRDSEESLMIMRAVRDLPDEEAQQFLARRIAMPRT